jgi:hypothetical protein
VKIKSMGNPIFQQQILVMVVAWSRFSPFPRFIHFALFIEIASHPLPRPPNTPLYNIWIFSPKKRRSSPSSSFEEATNKPNKIGRMWGHNLICKCTSYYTMVICLAQNHDLAMTCVLVHAKLYCKKAWVD